MSIKWTFFRLALTAAWLLVLAMTLQASIYGGPNGWLSAFASEMRQPWPAQFDTDFTVHLVLVAGWIVFRARTLALGLLFGVFAVLGGSLFSLAYLLVVSFQVGEDWRTLLLGRHARACSTSSA